MKRILKNFVMSSGINEAGALIYDHIKSYKLKKSLLEENLTEDSGKQRIMDDRAYEPWEGSPLWHSLSLS